MSVRAVVTNRFFVVPVTLAVAAIGWNLYVDAHNGGAVSGRVVPAGVSTVVLYERDMTSGFVERQRVRTDASGAFHITGNHSHMIQLEVISPEGVKSTRRTVRLWFRGQDVRLDAPLAAQ